MHARWRPGLACLFKLGTCLLANRTYSHWHATILCRHVSPGYTLACTNIPLHNTQGWRIHCIAYVKVARYGKNFFFNVFSSFTNRLYRFYNDFCLGATQMHILSLATVDFATVKVWGCFFIQFFHVSRHSYYICFILFGNKVQTKY